MVKVTDVLPRSLAERVGIKAEDVLISINGKEINDVLDYRFYLAERSVELSVKRGNEEKRFMIKKSQYDDIGLDFETPLMDKKHSCENKCLFCFIDQLPGGMRSSLYFKDDDSRLSFLHGNYITLTNLDLKDIRRIIDMHISPVNISVHTTSPELRVKMMKNKHAGEVLSYMKLLADAGISLRCQIVLCKGINDGEELSRTMLDLEALAPAMESTAIVPAGLTKFREGLYPLEPFSPEECASVIKQIEDFGEMCLHKHGKRLFYPSDEFYLKAGLPLPPDEFYEDYSQLENGVGMITDMATSIGYELEDCEEYREAFKAPRHVSIATGYASYEHMCRMAELIEEKFSGLRISVYRIKNNFFGEQITVSGLLTASDIYEGLKDKSLGDELLISASCLRAEGDVFLDDATPEELSAKLSVKITPTSSDAHDFISAVIGCK